ARATELATGLEDLAQRREVAETELGEAEAKRANLPDPEAGRAALEAARTRNAEAREAHQAAIAQLAAHD
ncbi:chromosome segregation protein SMC, partial [Novosphingobium sp. 2637]|nr:chromosome segregation protein SMC [Novosphingobium mangrovi (ex Hu et al. 2023)]